MFDGAVCRLGIDAANIDVKCQVDTNALDVVGECFGNRFSMLVTRS